MDKEEIFRLLIESGGEPRVLRKIIKEGQLPLLKKIKDEDFEKKLFEIKKSGIKMVFLHELGIEEVNFPDPPLLLFLKGEFPINSVIIGIVGTRNPDIYGVEVTRFVAQIYAEAGFVILSGGAGGIDTIAHETALSAGGKTIVILASGINNPYPSSNVKLFKKIEESGCLITEYPLGTEALKHHFRERNRLIAYFSDVLIVTQAPLRSGALITAHYAIKNKKPTFAVIGDIWYRNTEGCNMLLKKGAMPLLKPEDIMKYIKLKNKKLKNFPPAGIRPPFKPSGWMREQKNEKKFFNENEKKVINSLAKSPLHFDEIFEKTALSVSLLSHTLVELEMKGVVKKMQGDYYILIPLEN